MNGPRGPDFIIVGAQKAGTTALHTMLAQHSRIKAPKALEVQYFDNDAWYPVPGSLGRYHAFFPQATEVAGDTLLFERTPRYLYHPEVAGRLHRYNPKLKLVMCLRDPAQRALSAWTMYHHHFGPGFHGAFQDHRTFREAIEAEIRAFPAVDYYSHPHGYVKCGIYSEQVRRYLDLFPREQVLILESAALRRDPGGARQQVMAFLEIPDEPVLPVYGNPSRVDNKREHDPEVERLREFYRPHNEDLYQVLGCRFDWG